jgi:hypothetical protein
MGISPEEEEIIRTGSLGLRISWIGLGIGKNAYWTSLSAILVELESPTLKALNKDSRYR